MIGASPFQINAGVPVLLLAVVTFVAIVRGLRSRPRHRGRLFGEQISPGIERLDFLVYCLAILLVIWLMTPYITP